MWIALPLGLAALAGLLYLACYGGFGGPIERWIARRIGSVRHAPRDRNRVALSFDDGPDPARTPALLDALAELDVKTTFFAVRRLVPALRARGLEPVTISQALG